MATNHNQQPLRIVYLDFDDVKNPLLAGGQSLATVAVGKRLAALGHQVTSICSRYPGCQDRFENGIWYRHIGLGSRFIRLNNVIYILTLPFVVSRLSADILIECFTAPISTLGSPLFTKIPVVGLPSQFAASEFSRKYRLPFYRIERALLPYYRYFLPYTQDVLTRMRRYNPQIVAKIVPHGADPEYFLLKKKRPEYILFLGRLDIDQKGIDLLLSAYASIKDQATLPLVIAGHGADAEAVSALIASHGLEEKVKMIGGVYGAKKLKVMEKAAFVAFSSRYDDLPIFGLEALAAGLPIVCFDIPDLRFLTPQISWKARAFDAHHYGEVLLQAMQDPQLAKKQEASREHARRYDWDTTAREFESFFYRIVRTLEPKRTAHV